jgi:predicted amidohydrolase YtcJ
MLLLNGCGQPASEVPAPEQIFLGQFITLDESAAESEAIAVTGGRIVASGNRDDILVLAGDNTETITIPGIAVPGWVDAHVHVSGLGSLLEKLNVQAIDKQTILERVAAAAESTPHGEWIIGRGWDQGFFDVPVQPTAADLDAVAPEHPVILTRIGGHSAWVNSRALELAGIDDDTSDPRGGRIVRDASGHATGMLLEQAAELVTAVMPDTDTPEYLERRMREALAQYTRWGLTGVHDAGVGLDEIGVYKKLLETDELPVRVYAMALGSDAVEHYLGRGPEVDLGGGRLTVRSFKIFFDGALGARGAEMSAPYSDAPETSGLRQMEDAEIDTFFAAARAGGFQVNAHVIGDLGVERALDAIERNGVPASERFRLEHSSIISPPNLSRFAGLGAIASMQPVFVGEYQRWGESRVGATRAPWIMPMRDLLATGAILAAGTDFPASDSGDPRTTLYGLVTRKGFDGEPEGGWFPDQTVNVDTALRAMSEGPAFAAFREDQLGKLTVGRYADFTVLAGDPRTAPVESLLTVPVLMTVVGGKVTFDAAKQSQFAE